LSNFNLLGPTTIYKFDEEGVITDTSTYGKNVNIKPYWGFEPRLAASYTINESTSVKASYARTQQYIHLLSNTTSYQSTDLWIPSSEIVKPQIADQYSLGLFKNFKNNLYETSVEVYYKCMQNQIEYKNGAQFLLNKTAEADLVFGKGESYGMELYAKKRYGKLNGWVSYTLSFTNRTFDDIDFGNPFPAKQDRKHEISIVAIYQLTPKWTLSGTWVYYTGNAVTFPSGKYMVDNRIIAFYSERNGYRMPDYHRLDIGATWVVKKTKKFESAWTFSVYNAYNRYNAYSISFRQNEDNPDQTEAVKLSLFPIIPSISYSFKF
jgi:outer membrane receptor protein involved in Fe transport